MSGWKKLCPVKPLDDRTFCPLFYGSKVHYVLNTIGHIWTLLTFVKEKNWGGGEKKATRSRTFIKETVHNTEPLIGRGKKSDFVRFSETNSRKKRPISREFAGKFESNFAEKRSLKKANFGRKRSVLCWFHARFWWNIPFEQRFLSCMAFSVYEVVRVACLSRSWFVYVRNGLLQRFLTGREQTNYATDKPREWLRSKHWERPLLAG